jgi:hypothetical protein
MSKHFILISRFHVNFYFESAEFFLVLYGTEKTYV